MPEAALQRLLREARAELPGACAQPGVDRLVRILCSGRIRVGVRDHLDLGSTGELGGDPARARPDRGTKSI